ncbi:chitobiase/beta-hexosaminidase C-terminal domain-containing protein [Acetobacterium wieringae]|uniref:chitobiase/beta-hexosaminidase C-terminal domain-containing protein n=1 Tax=Acetobacterium wieringae TaxID=52694 RepID=UPI0026F1CBAE|nr:chitobiase/beta-hexosaminidase C-terminal domain-containing protein [Acetobacterium wieringae]
MTDYEHPSDGNEIKPAHDELNWAELERIEVDSNQNNPSQNVPPPKKNKKKLIIILTIIGSILILGGLTFFLYNQFATANLTSEEKIEKTTDQEELKKLYDELLSSYAASGKSEAEILALLERAAKETGDQSYIQNKDSYLVKPPSFNLAPGSYEGTQNLEIIKGNSSDVIYYTIDGKVPNTTSPKYTSAIPLPLGETTVKAIAMSDKGFYSATIEGHYNLTTPQTNTQSVLTPKEFINKIYGVWYKTDYGNSLSISQTTYTEHIPNPLSNATGDYIIVSTTDNGGTIKVLNFTVEGYNAGDILIEFDFGTPGDNQMRLRHEGKPWWDYTAADYIGNGQYHLPFQFAGSDIITLD